MKLTKLFSLLLAAVLIMAALAGCQGNQNTGGTNTGSTTASDPASTDNTAASDAANVEAQAVKLTVWAPENQIQPGTMNKMFNSFQALHPEWDITFVLETQGEDKAKDSILKDVAAAADVYFFANDQIAELVNAGAIAKLGGSTEAMVKETMADAVVDTVLVGGSVYAIPFTHNTFFMYYDKSLLNEEDIKSIEGIMNKDTADNVYNFSFDAAGGWKLAAWYYGAGLTIYGDDSVTYSEGCNWNNATGVAVTSYIIDLLADSKCAYNDDINVTELVADHRVGAWFDGSWNYQLYKDALGDDLGVAVLPTFNPDGNTYQLKGFYGSKAIGVNPQAANPAAAVAFAAYLGSEEMQIQRFEETNQVPTNINAGESAAVKADEVASVIVQEAQIASVMQPTNAEFGSRYWANAGAFIADIRNGIINKDNLQDKLNQFSALFVVE